MRRALALADFEKMARRRLPRALFGYVAGGVETDLSLRLNSAAFDRWAFRPRVLCDIAVRDTSVELFGRRYAAPFGVAPMGGLALGAADGDRALAAAAAAENVPFLLSGASCTPMEAVRAAGATAWFQAYLPASEKAAEALVARVLSAGFDVLVVTVDVPVVGNRENNLRLGFSLPLRPSLRLALDAASRPGWLCGTFLRTLLASGMPHFENYGAVRSGAIFAREPTTPTRRNPKCVTWTLIEAVRRLWPKTLVLKGVLTAADAKRAVDCGIDGVIVSNHGGRQLDGAIAPLDALPEVVAAVPHMPVMMDGGVRRGSHVLKALALGARSVFVGRPMYYAVACGGMRQARRAIRLLAGEVDRDMALLGIGRLDEIDSDLVSRV